MHKTFFFNPCFINIFIDPSQDEGGPDAVEDTWKPPMPDFSDETMDDKCPSKFDYLQVSENRRTQCM